MKAWVLYGPSDIRFEEKKITSPDRGWVQVKVCAAGICGSDVPRIFYTGAHKHPLIPGHEFAGEVVKVADSQSEELIGKRVGVFPLIPCKKCDPCLHKKYEMCRNYNYLGSRCDGGFAEYVNVPAANLIELPKDVSYEKAAMLEPLSVAVHAMRQVISDFGQDRKADVFVCGLGTIGQLLIKALVENGCENVYAIGNKDIQKECVLRSGIKEERYIDIRKQDAADRIREITDGKGAEIFFECVGRQDTINLAVDTAAPSGRLVFVGNPASDIGFSKETYWKILRNQLRIFGTWNSSFTGEKDDDWHFAAQLLASEKADTGSVISHRFELSGLMDGLLVMRDKKEEYEKIILGIAI
ncbi:MAG: galactitol-1-phosphate 5-dehydrogenase [Lachnospiraceae bacterium]|nr:galactitol-1-phosphate 5-dehydrogenase [Lachnospiraceae bacterium]